MLLSLEDRAAALDAKRAKQERRVSFMTHHDGSGSVAIYYGKVKQAAVSLMREDWAQLEQSLAAMKAKP